jgi:hypothetical protein
VTKLENVFNPSIGHYLQIEETYQSTGLGCLQNDYFQHHIRSDCPTSDSRAYNCTNVTGQFVTQNVLSEVAKHKTAYQVSAGSSEIKNLLNNAQIFRCNKAHILEEIRHTPSIVRTQGFFVTQEASRGRQFEVVLFSKMPFSSV